MLKISNLNVYINDLEILKDFSLDINDGEIVALMGPNGVGKSTVCKVLIGNPNYEVKSGEIVYNGDDLLSFSTHERAKKGLYLVNQNPIEISGVTNADMLRSALECITEKHINFFEFNKRVTEVCKSLKIDPSFIHRGVNEGMSGGEKKKNEILHLAILNPKLILLDELDSGLDVDALKDIAIFLQSYIKDDVSVLIITHHSAILNYLKPDKVCILKDKKISKIGDSSLANEILKTGFRLDEVSE